MKLCAAAWFAALECAFTLNEFSTANMLSVVLAELPAGKL